MTIWALLLLPALPAFGASRSEPPAPKHTLTISDDKGEYAWRQSGSDGYQWMLKTGALALTESFPYPYPILKRSPYVMGGMTNISSNGPSESALILTIGVLNLRSQRLFNDPAGLLGSSANQNTDREVSQNQLVASVYADQGRTFRTGGWNGAVFAALDQFVVLPMGASGKYASTGMTTANIGTAWLKGDGAHEVFVFADAGFEMARRKLYSNEFNVEAARSGKAGTEYAYKTSASRYFVGIEGQTRRADSSLRPYLGVKTTGTEAVLAAEFRKSKDPFFPDATAVAMDLKTQVSDSIQWQVTARRSLQQYDLAPEQELDTRVMANLVWTPDARSLIRTAHNLAASQAREYEASQQQRVQTQASATRSEIRAHIEASPSLDDFYNAYKPTNSLGILAAAAEFTSLFNQYNYNNNEGSPPNLENVNDIYQRTRQSYLSRNMDPTLVCLGAAQFAAAAAEELGRRNGVRIEAAGVTMKSSSLNGKQSGHAVAAVKTSEYGIVFVDWGRITPTYTWNTEEALRLYQALGGQPAIFHQITDPSRDGRHVGYLFTEEGKLLINNLTFHSEAAKPMLGRMFEDAPSGDQVTIERYKQILGRKP